MASVAHALGPVAVVGAPDLDTLRVGGGSGTGLGAAYSVLAHISFETPRAAMVMVGPGGVSQKIADTDDPPDLNGNNLLPNRVTMRLDFEEIATPVFDPVSDAVIAGAVAWGATLPFRYFEAFWCALTFNSPSGRDPLFSISLQADPTAVPRPVLVYGCGVYTQP